MGKSLPTPEGPLTFDYVPRPQFRPYHERRQRHAVQICHRRAGKTVACINELRDRCRVRNEEHIAILEHIARYSENEGFRLAAIRDLFDRGRGRPKQAIEGSGPGGAIPFSVILPAALCDDA